MKREILLASKEHEQSFRKEYQLKPEYQGNPECKAAYEYAARTKLYSNELDFLGAIIEKRNE